MKETFAVVAALLAIVGNVPYILAVLKGTVKPHPYTWLVGSVVSCVIFFGQLVKGAGIGALPTAASEIFTLIIFVLSLRYGFKGITKTDTFFLTLALAGIIPWLLTKDPTLSIIMAVAIDVAALVPTMRKTWLHPTSEKPILYAMNVVRHTLALFSLQAYNIATTLHSIVMIIVNTFITMIIYRKRLWKNFQGASTALMEGAGPTVVFSGQLGIVLLLENSLEEKVITLSKDQPEGNRIDLGGAHTPHITLYHSKFKNIPEQEIETLLIELAQDLPQKITFTKLKTVWERFVFCEVEKTPDLQAMHEKSLTLLKYFAHDEQQLSGGENNVLSLGEIENVKKYGNPLVYSLWRPHTTIGYYDEGAEKVEQEVAISGTVDTVAFVRIGEYGTVVKILAQRGL